MFLQLMHRTWALSVAMMAFIVALAMAASVMGARPSKLPSGSEEKTVSSLIVKPRAGAGDQIASALHAFDASGLSKTANVPLSVLRKMSGGAHVIKLERRVTLSEARVIATRLMHNDPSLEYAEPDRIMHPLTTPTDPDYGKQWHYFAPAGANQGGANLPLAWDVTKGSSSVVVAVIDSGYRPHKDFAPILPGFDFITNPTRANDGDGQDADAQDPGNWVAADECDVGTPAKNSVWHGTHVTGTIAALMNNAEGGTGIAPNVKILPVRVTGKCGGLLSDIIDGMRWAAGLSVAGVPANPNPAKILNLSIGDHNACSQPLQDAVTEIVNAGKVIVAATDNDGDTTIDEPANCTGVIAVAAHAIDGDLAYYSNVGPQVAISAPGGDCGKLTFLSGTCAPGLADPKGPGIWTTYNSGVTSPDPSPGGDSYFLGSGTSSAAPHVSGVAALLLSVKPMLTPGQIKSILQSSARPFPAGSWCITPSSAGLCGAGLLDAHAALQASSSPAVTITNASQVVAPNTTVLLSGTAVADSGRSISSYAWTQLTGPPVGTIANNNRADASFTAPATGTLSFRLTATDSSGLTGMATATVRVNSPPVLTAVTAQTVAAGTALNFVVGATDVDGDAPIFVSVSLPPGASLSATGTFSWPAAIPVGSYVLTYFARDNDANSTPGTVNISVVQGGSTAPPAPIDPPSSGGGGGCTLSQPDSVDMLLPALFLLSLALWAWRLKKRPFNPRIDQTGRK